MKKAAKTKKLAEFKRLEGFTRKMVSVPKKEINRREQSRKRA